MKLIWQSDCEREVVARLGQLRPDHTARWGRLTCPQMVVHITDALAMYMGDLSTAGRWTPLRYTPLKQAFIYVLPIPRNVATAPELVSRTAAAWDAEIERFLVTLAAFCASRDRDVWPMHPLFGHLSRRAWGALAYKHTDHHLRQFGV